MMEPKELTGVLGNTLEEGEQWIRDNPKLVEAARFHALETEDIESPTDILICEQYFIVGTFLLNTARALKVLNAFKELQILKDMKSPIKVVQSAKVPEYIKGTLLENEAKFQKWRTTCSPSEMIEGIPCKDLGDRTPKIFID